MQESFELLNVKDLQKMWPGVGRNSIYKLLKDNKILHFKIGPRYFITREALEQFLNSPHERDSKAAR